MANGTWQLQQAKNKLSEVVRRAREEGPQTITVHGRPAVVVVAAEEWDEPESGSRTRRLEEQTAEYALPIVRDPVFDKIVRRDANAGAPPPKRLSEVLSRSPLRELSDEAIDEIFRRDDDPGRPPPDFDE